MTEIRTLGPHDPLPGGHSVVLMRRFSEDAPDTRAIELIVTNPDRSEETATPTGPDGMPLGWDDAVAVAKGRAEEEGLKRIWTVDRTAGTREQEVIAHGGDRTIGSAALADDDLSEGETGSDMRDVDHNTAPRRF